MAMINAQDLAHADSLNGDFYQLPHSDLPLALAILRSDKEQSEQLQGLKCLVLFPGMNAEHMHLPQNVLTDYVLLKITDPKPTTAHYGFCTALYDEDDAGSWQSPVNWELVDIVLQAFQDLCNLGCEPRPRAIAISAGGHKLMAVLARMATN